MEHVISSGSRASVVKGYSKSMSKRRAFDPGDPDGTAYDEWCLENYLSYALDDAKDLALDDAENDFPALFVQTERLGLTIQAEAEWDEHDKEIAVWLTIEGHDWNCAVSEDLNTAAADLAKLDREHPNLKDLVESTEP